MDKCRLSIVIPVYNAEDYLDRCIESIVSQNFTSYEVILVDDGSTDSSPMICDRHSSSDPRFRTIHKTNGGVSSARNAGMDLAKGEYLMFVDSDDALLPGALKVMTDSLEGEDLVLGGYVTYMDTVPRKEMNPLHTRSYNAEDMSLFFEHNIRKNCEMLDAPWAKMFRRKAVGSFRFNESLSYAEDKLFVFAFLASCSSARTVTDFVYAYHLRSGSLGSDICSDRHLIQLRRFLPSYAAVLKRLSDRYPACAKVTGLYHNDLIGRYACRILNIFLTRRTEMLSSDFIGEIHQFMDRDQELTGIFSLRPGQVLNLLIWRMCSASTAVKVYRPVAAAISLFRRK